MQAQVAAALIPRLAPDETLIGPSHLTHGGVDGVGGRQVQLAAYADSYSMALDMNDRLWDRGRGASNVPAMPPGGMPSEVRSPKPLPPPPPPPPPSPLKKADPPRAGGFGLSSLKKGLGLGSSSSSSSGQSKADAAAAAAALAASSVHGGGASGGGGDDAAAAASSSSPSGVAASASSAAAALATLTGSASPALAVTHALRTLATFNWASTKAGFTWLDPVTNIVRMYVPRLLEDDKSMVRLAAARCCCTVLDRLVAPRLFGKRGAAALAPASSPSSLPSPDAGDAVQLVHHRGLEGAAAAGLGAAYVHELTVGMMTVLDEVVTVGVADCEAEIRADILSSLAASSDPLLLKSHHALALLTAATTDEAYAVREAGLAVLCRLAHRAPLSVMPLVRQCASVQMELLEHCDDLRSKEDAINLLRCVARGGGTLIEPYVAPILRHVLRQLKSTAWAPPAAPSGALPSGASPSGRSKAPAGLVQACLAAAGELSLVSHDAVRPHLPALMPEIIVALKDRTVLDKAAVAMRALGQIISSTGDVVQPYARYPELLDAILGALQSKDKTGAAKRLQLEALRTVGILGALSPEKLDILRATGTLPLQSRRENGRYVAGGGGDDDNAGGNGGSVAGAGGGDDGDDEHAFDDDEDDEDGGLGMNYNAQSASQPLGRDGPGSGEFAGGWAVDAGVAVGSAEGSVAAAGSGGASSAGGMGGIEGAGALGTDPSSPAPSQLADKASAGALGAGSDARGRASSIAALAQVVAGGVAPWDVGFSCAFS